MLFRGLIHNKQAMCYSSQKKGTRTESCFFLPKYENCILPEQNKSANDIQSAGQPQSGTELASRVGAALTDAAAYLRFLGRLAAG